MVNEKLYELKQTEGYFSTARREILPLLPRTASRVLEIGCGDGATLALLKDLGVAEWVFGIDIFEKNIEAAKAAGVDRALKANVEDFEPDLPEGSMDVILCLDVLEHLVDPWSVVRRLSKYVKPGGVLIASIPNAQNAKVVVPLTFFGQLEYKDSGILDRTHLRFFTKRTAMSLVSTGGLVVDACLTTMEKHPILKAANWLSLSLLRRFFTVQFVIRARKRAA